MASQPLMNSSNIAEFWKERLTEIRPKFFLTPSVPAQHTITQNSTLNQPLVEQAVHILTHNPTLLSKPEVVGQAILQDNHLNNIHSTASIHYAHNPFPKELRVALQRLIRSGIRDCGDQPLPHWAQTGRETKDVLRSGGRDTLRTVPTKRSFSAMGQLPNTPFRLPASSSSASEFRPYATTFDSGLFAEEYQQTSVAIESAIGATHPALDLFYQMNCLKSNIARIDGEIEALSFLRRASVMQLASLRNRYERDSHLPDPPASLPADPTPTPTPSPAKKVPKETKDTPKETPKEPKEKKPKLAKAEAPSSKVTTEGCAKVKAKETATKTKAKAAREPSEVKTQAKTQAASTAEASKGKGKQRAAVKPKTVVEKKETVEEPVKEKEKEEEPEKETVPETIEEEGEVLSWGDEDIEMEETGAAGEVEAAEEEADLMEEEEESE
ncbi:hypothetical protein H1R20_g15890, partial [Candolleomyces eurysporus]